MGDVVPTNTILPKIRALFYIFMRLYFRNSGSKEKVLARIDELRDIFFLLVQEPASKEATNKLLIIVDETFFNVPD
ncbi:hypothetical protein [Paenibacillus sp. PL2-23]|uniref:hypothetical protein n=1 Tax=Paenibacillus sp. PL2-23 TaxID=2100729 RepID=UPI0030FAAD6B